NEVRTAVRPKRRRRPAGPVRLGAMARDLRPDARPSRQPPYIPRPRVDRAGADVRLPEVIEDEALARKAIRELRRDRQMPTIYKDVVGEAELFEQREAGAKRGTEHESIVRLALHDV